MKTKITVAALFTLCTLIAGAQLKQELTLGAGPAFFGSGDVYTSSVTGSYLIPLTSHFGFESQIISATGWKYDLITNSAGSMSQLYNYSQASYLAFAGSLVYTPFPAKASFLKLKSGVLFGSFASSYGGVTGSLLPTGYVNFHKEINKGLKHTVGIRIMDRPKFHLGTELSMLTSFSEGYYNCDGFVWNIVAGFKI